VGPANASRLLDPGERPAQTAEWEDLLWCGVAQDGAHAGMSQ
jgi:hypothetical protein